MKKCTSTDFLKQRQRAELEYLQKNKNDEPYHEAMGKEMTIGVLQYKFMMS